MASEQVLQTKSQEANDVAVAAAVTVAAPIELKEEKREEEETIMNPWEVKGHVNYMALINKFGTTPIDGALIERWERVTKHKIDFRIRRGLVFSHQDIDKILDCVEKGIPVYLYTGRGPSSDRMHLGHLVPFQLSVYLQKALNCIIVIQMSDDEKYAFKKEKSGPVELKKYAKYSRTNAKDIIACGFDLDKTLIFSDLESYNADFHFNNWLIMGDTNANTIKATFGLGETLPLTVINRLKSVLNELRAKPEKSDADLEEIRDTEATIKKFGNSSSSSLAQMAWAALQCGPAYASTFKGILIESIKAKFSKHPDMPKQVAANLKKTLKALMTLGVDNPMMCFVPMAIDQAVYFRMARDLADTLKCPKPAVIHSEFLPGLKQTAGKMSTTDGDASATLFLDMKPKDVINIIRKHAFSGGRVNKQEHERLGANIKIDICYQYLTYFEEDDEKLKEIAKQYTTGKMMSSEIKRLAGERVAAVLQRHQDALANVTEEIVDAFFNWNRVLDIGGCWEKESNDVNDGKDYVEYDNYGIKFDRTFGQKCKEDSDLNIPNGAPDELPASVVPNDDEVTV